MTDNAPDVLQIADRLFRAIEDGDLDTVRSLYAPDIVVWANFDNRDQTLDRSMKVLGWLCSTLRDRHYDVRRRDVIPGGFLQEHVLRGTAPDGSTIALSACIIATVADGLITGMHEYLDPTAVSALAG